MTDAEKLAKIKLRIEDLASLHFKEWTLFEGVNPEDKKLVEILWNRLWGIKHIVEMDWDHP